MFAKILVPLDGSQLAERALKPALQLARQAEGELYILQVTQPQEMLISSGGGGYAFLWPEQSLGRAHDEAKIYLDTVLDTFNDPLVELHPLLEQGDPAGMIVDIAHEEGIDLIVMSSHGYTGFTRWVLGSTAEKVVRGAGCPVLVVRDFQPIKNILVTLDGSELAEQILEPAYTFAQALGANITMLSIKTQHEPIRYEEVAAVERVEKGLGLAMLDTLQQKELFYLEDVVRRYADWQVPTTYLNLEGSPAEQILAVVERHNIDLIAMSTHGRTGLRRWVYGSITEKVLHSVAKSMLVVRPANEQLN
jgi:nucleotide-binding universal stress UspA family protein